MFKIIPFEKAVQLGFSILLLIGLFHLSFILGILLFDFVPKDFLWGGRMKTTDELLEFEIISVITSLFGLLVIWIRNSDITPIVAKRTSRYFLWIFFILFNLNTIGNLLADSYFEQMFSAVTVVLVILFYRMAIEPLKIHSQKSIRNL